MRYIGVVAVPRAAVEAFLKSTSNLVQRRTWVRDGTGRKGHYRMQWVDPSHDKATEGKGQMGLFDSTPTPKKLKKYYVTMQREGIKEHAWLAGPYDTHEEALARVADARRHAYDVDPRSHFDAFGTASYEAEEGKHFKGKLNDLMEKKDEPAAAAPPAPKTKKKKSDPGDYKLYHDSFTSAIDEVIAHLAKQGLYMDEDEVWTKISSGPGKPKDGRTDRYSLALYNEDGTPAKKAVAFQVADLKTRYELNMYNTPLKAADYDKEKGAIRKPGGQGDKLSEASLILKDAGISASPSEIGLWGAMNEEAMAAASAHEIAEQYAEYSGESLKKTGLNPVRSQSASDIYSPKVKNASLLASILKRQGYSEKDFSPEKARLESFEKHGEKRYRLIAESSKKDMSDPRNHGAYIQPANEVYIELTSQQYGDLKKESSETIKKSAIETFRDGLSKAFGAR